MIALIDNYDSFVYNLYQYIGALDPDIRVFRNNEVSTAELKDMKPSHIVLSPGPGKPADAGVCEDVVLKLGSTTPILGVCLGHQAICEAFGTNVGHAKQLMHGKQSIVKVDPSSPLFAGLPKEVKVARYHSLAADENVRSPLKAVARTEDGTVMAVQHESWPVFGVQFHPESILTPDGRAIIGNFLATCR